MKKRLICLFLAFIFIFVSGCSEGGNNIHSEEVISMEGKKEAIAVNQLGFKTGDKIYFSISCDGISKNEGVAECTLLDAASGKAVQKTNAGVSDGKDLGLFFEGAFSGNVPEGRYTITYDNYISSSFTISDNIYDKPLQDVLQYFQKQRCGDQQLGWNGPCHIDDGVLEDTGEYLDVSGGWHDACDVRKWCSATMYGMIYLIKLSELYSPSWDKGQIKDELLWGNKYFLAMQTEEGYLMGVCGDDSGNRWTDNIKNSGDERIIRTRTENYETQYRFVYVQSYMYRYFKDTDREYAEKCLEAAKKCARWIKANVENNIKWCSPAIIGSGISAMIQMFDITGDKAYRDRTMLLLSTIMECQNKIKQGPDEMSGMFYERPGDSLSYFTSITEAGWPVIGLCDAAEYFSDNAFKDKWIEMAQLYCESYLVKFSKKNAFGIVPYALSYKEEEGFRKYSDNLYYRYFMYPYKNEWWVGNNQNITGNAIALVKLYKLTKNEVLKETALRQLDFVLGNNPFLLSTMTGDNLKDPRHYIGNSGNGPQTPLLNGAVRNGLGADEADMPKLYDGWWQTCEYWTPMTVCTAWLMAELASIK